MFLCSLATAQKTAYIGRPVCCGDENLGCDFSLEVGCYFIFHLIFPNLHYARINKHALYHCNITDDLPINLKLNI